MITRKEYLISLNDKIEKYENMDAEEMFYERRVDLANSLRERRIMTSMLSQDIIESKRILFRANQEG